jgi:sugar porter (SP) family MFS transporter
MSFLPRSPRWLVQKNRRDDALRVLYKIRSEAEAYQELEEISEEIEKAKKEGEPVWSELLSGRIGRLLLLGVMLQLLQQLVGMNAFMYFGPKIFKNIFGEGSGNTFTTINNAVNFVATFPAVFLADRAGRRSLMLWSAIGMTLACAVMGTVGLMFLEPNDEGGFKPLENEVVGWVLAGSIFFFVANFAFGFGPIVWVYVAEIFPLRYRSKAFGLCTMANWVGNFAIAQFTPVLLDTVHFTTFFIFGFFCAIGVALSSWLPETRGVPLELVGQLFDGKTGFKGTSSAYQGVAVDEETDDEVSESDE